METLATREQYCRFAGGETRQNRPYLSGEFVHKFNRPPVRVIGIDVATKSVIHDDVAELIDVYRGGADVVIGCVPCPAGDGTWGYIIGKTSDFVPCFLKDQNEEIPTTGVFFDCQA